MVWALALALALLVPSTALAVEGEDVQPLGENPTQTQKVDQLLTVLDKMGTEPINVEVDNSGVEQKVETLSQEVSDLSKKVDLLGEMSESDKKTNEQLDTINKQLETLTMQTATPEIEVAPLKATSNNTLSGNVYGNVSPTSQYAAYAARIVPKMGFSDDYVFYADSSSSYVLVWGDISLGGGGVFTGTGCKFTRWYYSGTGTGYLTQSGSADLNLSAGQYVVLSTLGTYPLLDDGVTMLRHEMGFYMVCAVALYSLSKCLAFTLRMRGGAS